MRLFVHLGHRHGFVIVWVDDAGGRRGGHGRGGVDWHRRGWGGGFGGWGVLVMLAGSVEVGVCFKVGNGGCAKRGK